MGVAYKNFWSINTDEAVVAGHLRCFLPKHVEIFMPLNAQMRDVDLLAHNFRNKKTISIQVKGSRAYEPQKKEKEIYGDGSATWFMFKREVIDQSTADYFIFLHYIIEESISRGRRRIEPHLVIIPTTILKDKIRKNGYVVRGNRYALYTWVNPKTRKAFGIHKNNIDFTPYLDKKGIKVFIKELQKPQNVSR